MPTAPCSFETSLLCSMRPMVTSPGSPPGMIGGTGSRTTFRRPWASHRGRVRTLSGSKYLQLRINRAAAGSARITVLVPVGASCRSVASLQWSLLCWDMMTRSGSGSSCRDDTQAGCLWVVNEILGWNILDEPVIQGSRRIRYGSPVVSTSLLSAVGLKVRRKDASPFKCLTWSAILLLS